MLFLKYEVLKDSELFDYISIININSYKTALYALNSFDPEAIPRYLFSIMEPSPGIVIFCCFDSTVSSQKNMQKYVPVLNDFIIFAAKDKIPGNLILKK